MKKMILAVAIAGALVSQAQADFVCVYNQLVECLKARRAQQELPGCEKFAQIYAILEQMQDEANPKSVAIEEVTLAQEVEVAPTEDLVVTLEVVVEQQEAAPAEETLVEAIAAEEAVAVEEVNS